MRSTCLAIGLIRSRIMSLRLIPISVTLNGEMALILRHFTEFDNGPYFALFYRIRVRCRRKTIC